MFSIVLPDIIRTDRRSMFILPDVIRRIGQQCASIHRIVSIAKRPHILDDFDQSGKYTKKAFLYPCQFNALRIHIHSKRNRYPFRCLSPEDIIGCCLDWIQKRCEGFGSPKRPFVTGITCP